MLQEQKNWLIRGVAKGVIDVLTTFLKLLYTIINQCRRTAVYIPLVLNCKLKKQNVVHIDGSVRLTRPMIVSKLDLIKLFV